MTRIIAAFGFLIFYGCVEPFDFTAPNRKVLVVESILTNELKRHEVLLSWAYRSENDSILKISGATVTIADDLQNEFLFSEIKEGQYVSNMEFVAKNSIAYTLHISLKNGNTYRSSPEKFESESQIVDVNIERGFNSSGKDGILISTSAKNIIDDGRFFRYEYEETYKIIAPQYVDFEFKLENYNPCRFPENYDLSIVPREEQQRVCFGFRASNEIIQVGTNNQNNGNVNKQLVRFIPSDDYILSHRYSILIKQYAQSERAFNYYKTLNNISSSESVFTNLQPGFLEGNVKSDSNDEVVLGLFEVASVSSNRVFFNYSDYYVNEPLPDYPFPCNKITRPPLTGPGTCNELDHPVCEERTLWERITNGTIAYWNENGEDLGCDGGPYMVIERGCGDCTLLGSNQVPDFWIE